MLNKLFSSKTRVKLLKLFLFNPEKQFFVRELTRILDEHLNSIRRELSNLEEIELIKCVEKKNYLHSAIEEDDESSAKIQKKYYQVNSEFPFYSELKSLFLKAEVISEDEIKEKVKKINGVQYFVLTGAFTNSNCPIDLLAVGEFDNAALLELIKEWEGLLGKELNYTVMTRDEFVHRLNLLDKFLYKILESSKIVIKDEISEGLNIYMSQTMSKEESTNIL